MGVLDDGGSGKSKSLDFRSRHQLLVAVFALGACVGVVLAERIYIATNREDILNGVSALGGAAAAQELAAIAADVGEPATASAAERAAAAARAEAVAKDPELKLLKSYLTMIAPEREVLIGVSNKNPMLEGMLDTWLEGVKQAGVSAPHSCPRKIPTPRAQRGGAPRSTFQLAVAAPRGRARLARAAAAASAAAAVAPVTAWQQRSIPHPPAPLPAPPSPPPPHQR
jgi:hypothetical protein